jgi:Uncharacterized protein conserved in bacteria (DUF2252)
MRWLARRINGAEVRWFKRIAGGVRRGGSVLEPFAAKSEFSNQGQRVVERQRLMQSASDMFLGWLRQPLGLEDSGPRDLYLRQLWDSKISADISAMRPSDLAL